MKLGSKLVLQTVLPAVAAVAILLAIVTQVTSSALRTQPNVAWRRSPRRAAKTCRTISNACATTSSRWATRRR
jgi:hypothetical protein